MVKYNQAMDVLDSEQCKKRVQEEYDRMKKNKLWRSVPKDEVLNNAKVVTSNWEMKKKSNGTYRESINACGFEQRDQDHYYRSTIYAPVTKEAMVRIVKMLMVMAGWDRQVLNVKGTYLHGEFEEG